MTLFPEAANIMNTTPWLANKDNPLIAQARQFGKIFLFKQIYGGTAASIAEDIKCTTDEAVVYLKKFFAKPDGYWELENEMKSTANLAKEQGWVRSATGRLIFVRESNAMGLEDQNTVGRKSFNAKVQGTAADISKLALVYVNDKLNELNWEYRKHISGRDGRIISVVH